MITLKTAVIIRLLIWRARRKVYSARHYAKYRKQIQDYNRERSKINRVAINSRCSRRRASDPNYKLRILLSNRLRNGLRSAGDQKTPELTMRLLGCTIPELRVHLENQFLDGMSWDNHGQDGWHIDHKKPCAAFDLTQPEQQRQCFHYTNLQPLWAEHNWSKGKKHAAD